MAEMDRLRLLEKVRRRRTVTENGTVRLIMEVLEYLLNELRPGAGGQTQFRGPLSLSRREMQVIQLVAQGMRNKAIGERLSITEGTVKGYVYSAARRLNAKSIAQAVVIARENGFL